MEQKICQSCGMPLTEDVPLGTNKDGSINADYCIWCYKDGAYEDDISTLEDYTDYSLKFAEQAGMTEEEMRTFCQTVLPGLKRWQK